MFRERYTILIVIPEDEALAVVPVLEKKIVETETEVVSIVCATSIITAIATTKKIYGITMLVEQAILCFHQWFGFRPKADRALLKKLNTKIK